MGNRGVVTRLLSFAAELAGVAAITYGFWVLATWLGYIVGGLLLMVVGLALDPPKRAKTAVAADFDGDVL